MNRPCGTCTACCEGWIKGNSYGNIFGVDHRPCVFLVDKKCSIYQDRPKPCQDYQCAWTQNLFPEWMKPDDVGLFSSVEFDGEKQFLRVIETQREIDPKAWIEIENFVKKNNTYYVRVPYDR